MAKENTDRLLKQLPIRKVADDKQEATGIFTAEVIDSDNEIADYLFQSKQIKAWADEMFQKTSAAGQEPSLGNVRLQHTSQPVGKVISYDDSAEDKTVGGTTYIQDANTWQMVKKGVLTGFSFGGHYLWRKCDECGGEMPLACGENFCPVCQKEVSVRYGAKIAELSVCDRPAVPVADILHIKADGSQTMHKAGQATMEKEATTKKVGGKDCPSHCFAYVGDHEKTATWKLPIESPDNDVEWEKKHIINALARFNQTKGIPADKKAEVKAKIVAAAKKHGIEVEEEEAKSDKPTLVKSFVKAYCQSIRASVEVKAAGAEIEFRKGLWEVAEFASALQQIAWLRYAAFCEREMEDDDSDVPDQLATNLEDLSDTFLAMAEEEIQELKDAAKKAGRVTDMKKVTSGLTKEEIDQLPEVVHDVMIGHLADATASHEAMADEHKAMADEHTEKAAEHKGFMDHFKKAAEDGGEHEEHHAIHADVQKSMMEHHEDKAEHHMSMHKAHSEMAAKCAKAASDMHAEKSVKALEASRAAKPVVKAYKKRATTPAGAAALPTDIAEAAKAASASVAAEWFSSEEYKEIERDRLRKMSNAAASERTPIITPAGVHASPRDAEMVKASKAAVADAEAEAVLGF